MRHPLFVKSYKLKICSNLMTPIQFVIINLKNFMKSYLLLLYIKFILKSYADNFISGFVFFFNKIYDTIETEILTTTVTTNKNLSHYQFLADKNANSVN